MTTRVANYLFLAGFLVVGAVYLWQSRAILAAGDGVIGPVMFPLLLGVLLVTLCLAEVVATTLRRDAEAEQRITLPNAWMLGATLLLTAAYQTAWEWSGAFYPVTAVYFLALALVYGRGRSRRSVAISVAVAAGFTLALYLVFGLAFQIQLS